MNRLIHCTVVLVLLSGGQRGIFAQEKPKHGKEAQVKAAIEGYLENRNSFPFLRCAYTETVAQTRTLEDALRGINYLNPSVSRRLLLVDGQSVMHTEDFDEAAFKKAIKNVQNTGQGRSVSTTPFSTGGYLSDGSNKFSYSPFLRCANVTPPQSPDLGVAATLLSLGNPTPQYRYGPDYQLELCKTGKLVMWPEGLKEIDGRGVICVKFGNQKKQPTRFYAFDVERGLLPLRIITYEVLKNSREHNEHYLIHTIKCSKGRWFPERSVKVTYPENKGDLFGVRETKVIDLDVDKRPKRSEFTLRVKAGTNILNPDNMGGFRLKQDEGINITDLAGLLEKCERSRRRPLMDTAIHPPDPYAWLRWGGYSTMAVLATGLAVYVVRRRIRVRTVQGPGTVG